MTLPSNSTLQVVPCIYDEGVAESMPCRIHAGQQHVHLAVCPVCLMPLTADLQPAFCIDTFDEPHWLCQYDDDAERSVLSLSEMLELYPDRADRHTPAACCTCPGYTPNGDVVHGSLVEARAGRLQRWVGPPRASSACYPPKANDPTRLRGCYCDRMTEQGLQP